MKRAVAGRLDFPPAIWRASRWQRDVARRTERLELPNRIWLNAGRGAGKDVISIRCILRDALKLYSEKVECMRTGKGKWADKVMNPVVKIWVVAPAENNMTQVWDDWRGELKALATYWGKKVGHEEHHHEWLFREIVREQKFVLFGMGQIEIQQRLTKMKGALRGSGVDFCHWTEFAHESAPGQLSRAYRAELLGTLTRAGRLGRMYATTTPVGPYGVFDEEMVTTFGEEVRDLVNGELTSTTGLAYYCHVDSFQNEFLSEAQLQQIEAERALGWFFQQERLARFVVGDKGGFKVFEREWIEKCLVYMAERPKAIKPRQEAPPDDDHRRRHEPSPIFRRVHVGVDIARFGNDWTALLAWDEDSGELLRIARVKHADGKELVALMEEFDREFPSCEFHVDDTGHRGYVADFAPKHLNITAHQFSREKEKWVGGLKMLLQMGRLSIPDPARCPWLTAEEKDALRAFIQELTQFVKVVKQHGGLEYRHPQGGHDDTVDGAMLGTMELAGKMAGDVKVEQALERVRVLMI